MRPTALASPPASVARRTRVSEISLTATSAPVSSRPTQAPDADHGNQLLEADAGAPHEVLDTAVGAGVEALPLDADGRLAFYALDEVESEGQRAGVGVGDREGADGVDARGGDAATE